MKKVNGYKVEADGQGRFNVTLFAETKKGNEEILFSNVKSEEVGIKEGERQVAKYKN